MSDLQKDFPDLSQSVIGEVLKNVSNNQVEATKILQTLSDPKAEERELKINELQQQFPLSKQEIIQALESVNWDYDEVIVPLFNKFEETQRNIKKMKEEENRVKREQEEKKKNELEAQQRAKGLKEMFQSIPKEKIQEILDKNEGDIEETTTELLRIVEEQEAKEIERKEKMKKVFNENQTKSLKIKALKAKFEDLTEEVIIDQLKSNNWDLKVTCLKCEHFSASKKIQDLKIFFPSLSDEEIQSSLDARNWDKLKAAEDLAILVEKRRKLQEKKTIEEKEKQEINLLKKQPKTEKQIQNHPLSSKVQDNLLERSTILVAELEKQIHDDEEKERKQLEEQEKKVEAIVREDLEKMIESQARFGFSPGVKIPEPQVNTKILKKKPVEEEEIINSEPIESLKELPQIQKSTNQSNFSVSLEASPIYVDSGNPITVEYEILKGQSSSWDWIGIYSPSKPNKKYETYQYRGRAEKKGTVIFTAPSKFGEYEFRYFNGSYEHSAISNRIVVGPQIQMQAIHDKETNKFKVTWVQTSGNSYPSAWIGFYEKSEGDNTKYITWEYANAPNNEVYFEVPYKPAQYEFRFFPTRYTHVATSNILTITGEDKLGVTFTSDLITVKPNIVSVDPYQDSAWIGLFEVSETNHQQWKKYKYVQDRTLPLHFKRPKKGGHYEVRLFAKKSYDLITKTDPFLLQDLE